MHLIYEDKVKQQMVLRFSVATLLNISHRILLAVSPNIWGGKKAPHATMCGAHTDSI